MKNIKKILKGGHGNFMHYALAATFLFLLFILFKPGSNIFNWLDARREISRQEKLIREYAKELEELDARIDLLTSDRDTLEKFAREKFHLAAPGEDVFILEE